MLSAIAVQKQWHSVGPYTIPKAHTPPLLLLQFNAAGRQVLFFPFPYTTLLYTNIASFNILILYTTVYVLSSIYIGFLVSLKYTSNLVWLVQGFLRISRCLPSRRIIKEVLANIFLRFQRKVQLNTCTEHENNYDK